MSDLDRLDLDGEFLRRCPVCGEDEWDDELHVDCRAEEVVTEAEARWEHLREGGE